MPGITREEFQKLADDLIQVKNDVCRGLVGIT